jgi:hypothetical protein
MSQALLTHRTRPELETDPCTGPTALDLSQCTRVMDDVETGAGRLNTGGVLECFDVTDRAVLVLDVKVVLETGETDQLTPYPVTGAATVQHALTTLISLLDTVIVSAHILQGDGAGRVLPLVVTIESSGTESTVTSGLILLVLTTRVPLVVGGGLTLCTEDEVTLSTSNTKLTIMQVSLTIQHLTLLIRLRDHRRYGRRVEGSDGDDTLTGVVRADEG